MHILKLEKYSEDMENERDQVSRTL